MAPANPIERAGGITETERYLKKLCDQSFLSLWSYPSLFRDQGRVGGKGDGKEVCDLTVIFGNNVLLFSDKSCQFPDSGNIDLDWGRWYKRAIKKSADQIWGGERRIKEFPDGLFLDRSCTQPFPIDFPDLATARFHRIAVAHGAAKRCRQFFNGGSGSLMIRPDIVGEAHQLPCAEGGMPFAVGQIDPARGFVHVLDEASLDIVMGELDTITDFVEYLTKKETFVLSGRLIGATGEEDLLARYFEGLNEEGKHDFVVPDGYSHIAVAEGHWTEFEKSPERRSRMDADKNSYAWDNLIEMFSGHMLAGTQYSATPHPGPRDGEKVLRFLAQEPRTRRRGLAEALVGLIFETPADQFKATRIIKPVRAGDPFYIFLLLAKPPSVSDETYRETRSQLLKAYGMVLKLKEPCAEEIIGIATETGTFDEHSEDAMYLDVREFTEQDREEAQRIMDQYGLLKEISDPFARVVREFPYPAGPRTKRIVDSLVPSVQMKGRDRNNPCPCGSGRKIKQCCGR